MQNLLHVRLTTKLLVKSSIIQMKKGDYHSKGSKGELFIRKAKDHKFEMMVRGRWCHAKKK